MSPLPIMLFAAGRGTRMEHLTRNTPKPLLKVAGKPLIEHHLERLATAGFSNIVINLGWQGEQIRQYLGDGSRWNLCIQYSLEPEDALETGGGMLQAQPLLNSQAFGAINADIYTDFPFQRLTAPRHLAHLILVDNPAHNPGGDFALNDQGLVQAKTENPKLTFAGIGSYRPELLTGQQHGKFSIVPLLKQAMSANLITGEHWTGQWHDVGTPERLRELNAASP